MLKPLLAQKDFSRTTLHTLQEDTYYCLCEFVWVTWIVPLPLAPWERKGCGTVPSPFAPDQLSPCSWKGRFPQLHLTSPLNSGCMSRADSTQAGQEEDAQRHDVLLSDNASLSDNCTSPTPNGSVSLQQPSASESSVLPQAALATCDVFFSLNHSFQAESFP